MQSKDLMMKPVSILLGASVILMLQACARDDTLRTEGLTLGAGDAIARNSALQIIDPWPTGVEDTDLSVPNTHPNDAVADTGSTPLKPVASQTNP
jgi:hypothetical protein